MSFNKFLKGQVWFIKNFNPNYIGSEQTKSRPCIIISGDQNNHNSSVIQVAPITTKPKDNYPFHVYFKKKDRNQIIELEQTTCISVKRMIDAEYMYSVDTNIINKIDKALMIHFGIFNKYSKLFNNLDRLLNMNLYKLISINNKEISWIREIIKIF